MNPIEASQHWLERAVIGLDLCPFAKSAHARGQVRWVLSAATTPEALLADLGVEAQRLVDAEPSAIETTLIVHPRVLGDFLDFNDFLDLAEALLEELDLDGTLQIASFHPDYQFADTEADDIGNYSNRSPHPTLQLLREDSVERAVATLPDPDAVFERNIQTLQALGHAGWRARMKAPDLPDAPETTQARQAADMKAAAPEPGRADDQQ